MAITSRRGRSATSTTCISSSYMGRNIFCQHHHAVGRRLVVGFCGQSASCVYYPAIWLRPTSPNIDTAEPFSHGPPAKVHAVPVCTNGALPHQTSATAVISRLNHIVDMCPSTKFFNSRLSVLIMTQPTA